MYEKNPFGFQINVEKEKQRIVFYLAGPDTRYNGKEYMIEKDEIEKFCQALKENFRLYQEKKASGSLKNIPGAMGMTIRFGLVEGVCFGGVYGKIRSEKKLEECISYIEKMQEELVS